MTELSQPATINDLNAACGSILTIAGGLGTFQAMAIVGALAEARVLDPMVVAKWAEFFAGALPNIGSPGTRDDIESGLMGFANTVRSMATKPAGSGEMRQ